MVESNIATVRQAAPEDPLEHIIRLLEEIRDDLHDCRRHGHYFR